MTMLWYRARIWYVNRLLDVAEWLEARKRRRDAAAKAEIKGGNQNGQ